MKLHRLHASCTLRLGAALTQRAPAMQGRGACHLLGLLLDANDLLVPVMNESFTRLINGDLTTAAIAMGPAWQAACGAHTLTASTGL